MQLWAWIALVLYLGGLLLAFGVTTWSQWRRYGTSGYRGVSGRPGTDAWWAGVLFVVALVFGIAGPPLVLAGLALPPSLLVRPVLAVTGVVLALAGLVFVVVAQREMGASWRVGVDESEHTGLVTTGLFGRVRNPVFTGMVAVAAGELLMVPTVVTLVALACLVVAVDLQVRVVEEPYLERVHGEAYRRYAERAGRFLPRVSTG